MLLKQGQADGLLKKMSQWERRKKHSFTARGKTFSPHSKTLLAVPSALYQPHISDSMLASDKLLQSINAWLRTLKTNTFKMLLGYELMFFGSCRIKTKIVMELHSK